MARRRNSPYRMTPKRKAALKKAQMISARKRSRLGSARAHVSRNRGKYAALAGVAIAGGVLGSRKQQTIARKQRAIKALNGKKITLSITRHKPMVNDTYTSSGIKVGKGKVSVYHGDRRHVTRIMGVNTASLTGGKTSTLMPPKPINRDDIPLYNPDNSKSWPGGHGGGAKRTRKKNKRLRREGLLE